MDEKFERVSSLKMCVCGGKQRNVEEERRERCGEKQIKDMKKVDICEEIGGEKKRGKNKIKKRKENKGSYVGGCWVRV